MKFFNNEEEQEKIYVENLKLKTEIALLGGKLDAINERWKSHYDARGEEIWCWKERGDKYSAHNDSVQKLLAELVSSISKSFGHYAESQAYKDAIAMIANKDNKK